MANSVPKSQLGKNGPLVPRVGFGLMGLSVMLGPLPSDSERLALLDKAYEIGERFWDTAAVYGDSEELVGKWLAKNPEKRKDIFLATKFGFGNTLGALDTSPEAVKRESESSLKRLGTDYIDLYYCHRVDGKTPVEQTIGAMAELVKEGKVKYLGLSEVSPSTLRRAHAVHPISAVQNEYSAVFLEVEDPKIGILSTCRELGVALVAWSPVGTGIVTMTSRPNFTEGDARNDFPRFSEENFERNSKIAVEIKKLASAKGCTSAQLALAWLLAQGDDIFPIPGTKRVKYLEENFATANVQLTPEEEKQVRAVIEANPQAGNRLPDSFMALSHGETPQLEN